MRRLTPLLVLPALLVVLASAAPATAAGPIAVVDVLQLMKAHPRYPELQGMLETAERKAQDYAVGQRDKLQKSQQEIELMNENDPARRKKEKEWLASSNAVKFELDWQKQEAQREWMRGLDVIYSETQRLVANYARTQGIQLVLAKNERQLGDADLNDWALKVQLRAAVYWDPSLDITAAVQATIPKRAGTPPTPAPGPAPAPAPAPGPAPAPVPTPGPGRTSPPPPPPAVSPQPGVPQPPR